MSFSAILVIIYFITTICAAGIMHGKTIIVNGYRIALECTMMAMILYCGGFFL